MAGLMSLPTWNVSGLDVLPFGSTTESRFGSAKANVRAHDGWPTRPVIGNRRLTPVHLVVGLGLYRGRMCQPPRPGNGKDNGHDSDQDNFRDSDVDALQQISWCCTLSLRRRHRRPDNGSLTHLRRFLLQGTFLWQLGVAVLSVQSPKMAWGVPCMHNPNPVPKKRTTAPPATPPTKSLSTSSDTSINGSGRFRHF